MFEGLLSKFWRKEKPKPKPKPLPPPRFLCDYDKEILEIYHNGFGNNISITTATAYQVLTLGAEKRDHLFTSIRLQSNDKANDKTATSFLVVDSASKLSCSTIVGSVPLKAMMSVGPLQRCHTFGLEYTSTSVGVRSLISWGRIYSIDISGAIGSHRYSVASDVSHCFTSRLTEFDVGAIYSGGGSTASLMICDRGDLLKSSVYHLRSSVGAEVYYRLSAKDIKITMCARYKWSDLTAVSARVDTKGDLGVIIHRRESGHTITISGVSNVKAMKESAKIGIGMSLVLT